MSTPWNIAVMLGGPSAEREVSLQSGRAVIDALESLGHRVTAVDPQPGAWCLPDQVDAVFLALHGTYGEDGTVQRELEALGVPYTGCEPEASACAFDKVKSKLAFVECGVPTPRFEVVEGAGAAFPTSFETPVVVKPSCQGSSVGVEIIRSRDLWSEALERARSYDSPVLVEEFIAGREITVGVIDGEVMPIVEVRPKSGYYDYHNKYTSGATDYVCPAEFPAPLTAAIGDAAQAALKAIGGGDYARVDFMVRGNEFFVLEVNTLPGMTGTSLLPKSAAARGEAFPALCERLVGLALERSKRSQSSIE